MGQETASGSLGLTTAAVEGRPGVSAKYLLSEIKDHKKAALLTLASIGCIALFVIAWFHAPHSTSESLPPMKVVPFTSYTGREDGAAFSPDGNQIAFIWSGEKNDNIDIYVKSIVGDKPLRLTTDPNTEFFPTWSPDGQKIAFLRRYPSESSIIVVPALGGSEHKLLTLTRKPDWVGWWHAFDWSADGKFIAYSDKGSKQEPASILLYSLETGEKRTLTSPPARYWGDFCPRFSPDSQTLAFIRFNDWIPAELYLVPITGGQPRRLTFDDALVEDAAWTSDGREIIFSSTRLSTLDVPGLWRIPVAGSTPERLPVGGDNVYYLSISLKGHRLAYTQGSGGDTNIYRIEIPTAAGRANSPVNFISSTRRDSAPRFSPDGHRITFESDRSGNSEIWTCDSDGSNPVPLTSLGARAGSPSWSPDGWRIAFDSNAKGNADGYVVSTEGGLPQRLTTESADDSLPSWSKDGQWIYFASNRSGDYQVWKMPVEGGDAVQITKQGGFVAFESPDGKFVYYTKKGSPGIWRVPVEGGEETLVFDFLNFGGWGRWAVVSDGIYFINSETTEGTAIEFFSFDIHSITRIAGVGKVNIFFRTVNIFLQGQGLAVSPDRRSFLYTQVDPGSSDIMLVENFR